MAASGLGGNILTVAAFVAAGAAGWMAIQKFTGGCSSCTGDKSAATTTMVSEDAAAMSGCGGCSSDEASANKTVADTSMCEKSDCEKSECCDKADCGDKSDCAKCPYADEAKTQLTSDQADAMQCPAGKACEEKASCDDKSSCEDKTSCEDKAEKTGAESISSTESESNKG